MMSQTNRIAKLKHAQDDDLQHARSLWQDAIAHILRDTLTLAAITTLIVMAFASIFGPFVVENVLDIEVNRVKVLDKFKSPGEDGYILGTDNLGRDQFIRLLYGGRISLAIAFSGSLMIMAIGVTMGLISGYYGGIVDDTIMWIINTLSSIPPLFILLVAAALWSPTATMLVVILALVGWFGTCRLVRGEVLSIRERDYVLAARALGASSGRLLVVHILPNIISIVIVTGSIIAGNLIILESGLSYLGVGVQPPTPTWGNMLTDARIFLVTGQHLVFWPGVMIMVTVLCFYLIGDGVRDAIDPRLKHGG